MNIVLNYLAQKLDKTFDENGELAKKGEINTALLNKLNALGYYQQPHPKSLGIEWCNEHIFPALENTDPIDALATFTEHAAQKIADVINEYPVKDILITGGGAYNLFLIEKIRSKTTAAVIIPQTEIINYKEALIFAFMGVLRMNNEINVLSSATGSTSDHSSGMIA